MTHRASDFPPKQVECRTGAELERKWLGGFRLEINREKEGRSWLACLCDFFCVGIFLCLFVTILPIMYFKSSVQVIRYVLHNFIWRVFMWIEGLVLFNFSLSFAFWNLLLNIVYLRLELHLMWYPISEQPELCKQKVSEIGHNWDKPLNYLPIHIWFFFCLFMNCRRFNWFLRKYSRNEMKMQQEIQPIMQCNHGLVRTHEG